MYVPLAAVACGINSKGTCQVCAEFHTLFRILPFLNFYLQGQFVLTVSVHATTALSCWTQASDSPTAFACQEGIVFRILEPLVRAPKRLALSLL